MLNRVAPRGIGACSELFFAAVTSPGQSTDTLVLDPVAAGGLDGEDDDENPEQRVKRRLAQNREAARKSRQRRKQYVAKLEEEVRRRLTRC